MAGTIFEALGFTRTVTGQTGVVVWVERNPYHQWLREQEVKHLNFTPVIKLTQVNCSQEMIEKGQKRLADWLYPTVKVAKVYKGSKKANRKKRWRCGVCEACKAKPCGLCRHCTIKALKQTCIMRACKEKTL
jgi:hypothetical protein